MKSIIIVIGATFLLYVGRAIFVPFLVAVFVWYLLNSIAAYYRKVMPLYKVQAAKNKQLEMPDRALKSAFDALAFFMSLATFGGLAYAFTTQIRPAFAGLIARMPEIQERLLTFRDYVYGQTGFSFDESMLPDTGAMLSSIGTSVTQFSAAMGLVLVYIFFIYIEQSTFSKKFSALFPQRQQFTKMKYIMKSIDGNMKKYMFMKTLTSFLTAGASYVLMNAMGLEFAGVWAFIIFILNYIPTVGTIIAVTLPVIYSLVTAADAEFTILLATGLIGLQVLISNILEPRLMGKALNLSTLAIIINLVFWGMLWGPVGMFFSVPLLVATFIATAQFDSTRWIAVLLSANGEIPAKEGD
ncbi:MAG: AI-2E family transporter [Alphaproteobacteria bacterium]|nr:AI-2E family transporter [Alphaproteobacteria bacterium]